MLTNHKILEIAAKKWKHATPQKPTKRLFFRNLEQGFVSTDKLHKRPELAFKPTQ
jgi:hypothetical protein